MSIVRIRYDIGRGSMISGHGAEKMKVTFSKTPESLSFSVEVSATLISLLASFIGF
jgi:hypothetical protein